jgi:hypothetical protein
LRQGSMDTHSPQSTLFLLFNHSLTAPQESDARTSLGIGRILLPPPVISRYWMEIPPDVEELTEHLAPVISWLGNEARPGDFALIQGEFGATFLLVNEALRLGLVPIYSTTRRQAVEHHLPDGQVNISHIFSHVRYRKYTFSANKVVVCPAQCGTDVKIGSLPEMREGIAAAMPEKRD